LNPLMNQLADCMDIGRIFVAKDNECGRAHL
jgi:hypothetical protein